MQRNMHIVDHNLDSYNIYCHNPYNDSVQEEKEKNHGRKGFRKKFRCKCNELKQEIYELLTGRLSTINI